MKIMDNEQIKDATMELLSNTNRRGIELVLSWLDTSDYFTAPASTNFHDNVSGGLARHSFNVYTMLNRLSKLPATPLDPESVVITALLHDVCKIDFYQEEWKNGKWDNEGNWDDSKPWSRKQGWGYRKDSHNLGHGEASVILLLEKGLVLLPEEVLAINWHMGGFDPRLENQGYRIQYNQAVDDNPLVLLLHTADMLSTRLS